MVIAVVGIVSAAVFAAINVAGNLTKANLANAKTFAASVENSLAINRVGKWSFEDDDTSDTALDTSGYNNNGDLGGSVTSCTSANPGGTCPTKLSADNCGLGYGKCLSFDGVNDYINAGNNSSLQITGNLTISAWIKPAALPVPGDYAVFVAKDQDSGDRGYSFEIFNNKLLANIFQNAAGTIYTQATGNTSLKINTWYHVAMAYSPSKSLTVYLNGVQDKTITSGVVSSINNSGDSLGIGKRITGVARFFNGQIDEISIYNQSLLSSQIRQLYAQGLAKHRLARK